ncbi:hypothetical protein F2P81_005185 [Scophthalmus maximus]|uniref:Uncharacterized protein n=1 Tax=Scophthalmus maximus TaxID=52904 RepID=A0A6A4T6L2_SCOMX|nr:hypothetical protein F2P81_005185 [Scophthalmus maximus]
MSSGREEEIVISSLRIGNRMRPSRSSSLRVVTSTPPLIASSLALSFPLACLSLSHPDPGFSSTSRQNQRKTHNKPTERERRRGPFRGDTRRASGPDPGDGEKTGRSSVKAPTRNIFKGRTNLY